MLRLGGAGKSPNNIERDLHRRAKLLVDLPIDPELIEVPRYHRRSGLMKMINAALICPHDLFGALFERPKAFVNLFGTRESWVEYWNCMREELWLKEHPDYEHILQHPERFCPFVLFGDDAQTSKRVGQNVKLMCWMSPLSIHRSSEKRLIPIYVMPTQEKNRKAIENLLDMMATWSFNAAAVNCHPHRAADPGCKLSKHRLAVAGKPICNGEEPTYLTYSGACGDWKWQVEQCADYLDIGN